MRKILTGRTDTKAARQTHLLSHPIVRPLADAATRSNRPQSAASGPQHTAADGGVAQSIGQRGEQGRRQSWYGCQRRKGQAAEEVESFGAGQERAAGRPEEGQGVDGEGC